MATNLKKNTTHVVLRQPGAGDKYSVWSEHRSEKTAIETCRAIGKNCGLGHHVVVPVGELHEWDIKPE